MVGDQRVLATVALVGSSDGGIAPVIRQGPHPVIAIATVVHRARNGERVDNAATLLAKRTPWRGWHRFGSGEE
jgi:hypothetical protein